MDALAQTALLVALTSFSLGFGTLARNVRNKLFILFAIGCTTLCAWEVFFFIARVWPENGWYGYHLSLNAWLAPVGLIFIQSMMRIERWFSSRVLFLSSLVLCLMMTGAVFFGLESNDVLRNIIYFTPTLIVVQVLILMIYDRKLDPLVGIRHRSLLYVGILLVLATTTLDHVPGLWVGVPIFGNFALTASLFFLSQAITQQRLLNVRALFSRFVVMVLLAVLLAGIYSLVAAFAKQFVLFFLNSFIASFFLLTLLEPIRTVARFGMDRVLTRGNRQLRSDLEAATRDLAAVVNPKDSLTVFERFLTLVLKPEGIAFYIPSADPGLFRRERSIGSARISPDDQVEISKNHPVFEAVTARGEPHVMLDQRIDDEIERMAGREVKGRLIAWRDAIHSLGGNIVFPFQKEGRVVGIAVIDVRDPPEAYGANWSILTEIEPLADRVGELLAKLAVFDREREVERLATLGEMAAGLAHEIRNPLGAIKGAAQYLDPSINRPESRFLSVILEEADRLNAVVTQFLDYAKPTATREYKEIDLSLLVQKVVTILSPTAPEGVDLRFQSSQLSAKVRCAPEQIHQVILNLIQNAFKSLRNWDIAAIGAHEKRVTVSLDSFESEDSRTMVRVTIDDNGPGIPKENIEKIFIPFFTTDPAGTGLGLPICRKIVQAHGGTIEVQSIAGVSTQFRVILPRSQV